MSNKLKLDKNITIENAQQVLEEQLFTVEDIKLFGQGFDNVAFFSELSFGFSIFATWLC